MDNEQMSDVERLSREIDPIAWDDRRWTTTRADVETMHSRRQSANAEAMRRVHGAQSDA